MLEQESPRSADNNFQPPQPELPITPDNMSPSDEYMFLHKEKLLSPEEREWLEHNTVAHIAPLWLELPRDKRKYGGAEDVALNIVTSLAGFHVKGQEIFGHPKNLPLEKMLHNTRVHYPPSLEYNSDDLLSVLMTDPRQAALLEQHYVFSSYQEIARMQDRLGIVHDHTNYGRDHAFWLAEKMPVVRTEHGPINTPDLPPVAIAHLELFKQTQNHWFIAISESQRQQMPDLPWIGVVHNGIDLRDFTFEAEKYGFPELGKYLLFLGRISRSKGTAEAIKVAKAVGMPLIIAGHVEQTEESERYYEEEILPHLNGNIYHLKGADREQRKLLLQEASCLMMLIDWEEPFGNVTAEALAAGTPVVGYRRGAVPEIIDSGKTGFVVDTYAEAVEATREVLRGNYDPYECRRRAELNFSRHVMTAKLAKIYLEANKRFRGESQERGLMQLSLPQ